MNEPVDAEVAAWWRALIKPIVIEMHKRGIKDIEIHKAGTKVRFVLTPEEVLSGCNERPAPAAGACEGANAAPDSGRATPAMTCTPTSNEQPKGKDSNP